MLCRAQTDLQPPICPPLLVQVTFFSETGVVPSAKLSSPRATPAQHAQQGVQQAQHTQQAQQGAQHTQQAQQGAQRAQHALWGSPPRSPPPVQPRPGWEQQAVAGAAGWPGPGQLGQLGQVGQVEQLGQVGQPTAAPVLPLRAVLPLPLVCAPPCNYSFLHT